MIPLLIVGLLLVAATRAAATPLEQTKALCREYTAGFVSPATDLAYGHRINGPKGIGALEKPDEIIAGRVRGVEKPMGYGSGIEDLAYHNALLLYALCDAEEKTGEPLFAEMAHRAFRGLKRMSELSPHRGFVPRGPHPDGKSYYKDSSLDQHTLYLCGLWRFYHSRLITAEEKTALRDIVRAVIMRLKDAGWAIQVEDGKAKSWEGGSMLVQDGKMPLVLLCMVGIAASVLDDATLRADYERFASEDNARRFASLAKPSDTTRPRRYTMFQNQHIIRAETLRRIETDPKRREILRQRTVETAEDMLKCVYLQAWRALEWLRDEPTKDPKFIPAANRYLAPLGLTFDSPITSLDLLKKFDPERKNPETGANHAERYEGVALATPAMVCQIALFSEKPDLIAAVQPSIDHLLTKVDWKKVNMGWAINYGTLAALWNVAQTAKPAAAAKPPPKQWVEEPFLPRFSPVKAVEFLDAGARTGEGNKCVNCHATFAYLMARPALPIASAKHAEVRSNLEKWVAYLEGLPLNIESDSRRRAEAVMAGAVLAQHDVATSGRLQPVSRRALDLMWRVQLPDGGYDWLKPNNEPPSAIDNHYGATMAAIGAGLAPDGYAGTPVARAGLEKIRAWLRTHPPQHMHQRGMLLLADHWAGGLMDEASRKQTVADMLAMQRPDGGWAMAALGDQTWKRKDKTPQDLTTSDGYGTGFCVYVLRVAGKVSADDARIRRAVAWLLTHQRESGYWYARSPKNSDQISTYVGTAYAVLALKTCGEIP